MFFTGNDKTQYAIADVASVKDLGNGSVQIFLRNSDEEIIIDEGQWDRALVRAPQTFVPALPETYVLNIWWESEKAIGGYYKKAVVGWSVGADGYLHPWTVDGVDDGTNDLPAILHPSGQVEDPINRIYENVVEWYEDAKSQALKKGYHNHCRSG